MRHTDHVITAADIVDFMDTVAPQNQKMEWDNVGLLCGSKTKEVTRVLIALDPFEEAVDEAIEIEADMLITHHPIIFQPIFSVTDETPIGRCLHKLVKNGIAVFNAHTNLDVSPYGVNTVLAETLELQNICAVEPYHTDSDGMEWGLLRRGDLPEQTLEVFLQHVKNKLNASGLRYVDCGKAVRRVAVGGGACAGELAAVIRAGCDTFVTSDVKYNQFRDAYDYGVNLIDAGHFYTEDPVCAALCMKLSAAFPTLEIQKSSSHKDCMKFFV